MNDKKCRLLPTLFDHEWARLFFALLAKIGARFAPTIWPLFLRTGDRTRSHGVNFFVEDEKRGLSLCPLQGRFLFDPVKKQKAFLFVKRNRNSLLVSAYDVDFALFEGVRKGRE